MARLVERLLFAVGEVVVVGFTGKVCLLVLRQSMKFLVKNLIWCSYSVSHSVSYYRIFDFTCWHKFVGDIS